MPEAHLPPRALRDYRHGRLTPTEMLSVSDHLAICTACRQGLAQTDDGPAYEVLADAADGILEPTAQQALGVQLGESSAATAELADLKEFVRSMTPQAGQVYRPSEKPLDQSSDTQQIVVPASETWRPRRWLFATAAAAAVLFVVSWAWSALRPEGETARLLTDRAGHRAALASLPADLRNAVGHALREGRLEVATLPTALRPELGTLAGGQATSAGFQVLSPQGAMVRSPRPTLRWTAQPTATAYVVILTSLDGTDSRTSPEIPGSQTTWTLPDPLTSGVIYAWQVEARRGPEVLATTPAPPAGEARFQILSEASRLELEETEARFGQFPLVMAAAFARVGLQAEAETQLTELAWEHPKSPIVERLRRDMVPSQFPSPINTKGAQ